MNLETERVKFSDFLNHLEHTTHLNVEGPATVARAYHFYLWAKKHPKKIFEVPANEIEITYFCKMAERVGYCDFQFSFTGSEENFSHSAWSWEKFDSQSIDLNLKAWMKSQIEKSNQQIEIHSDIRETGISIVIPHHNRSHLLKELLDSLAAQTNINFEVLIGDDASFDEHVRALKKIEKINWPFRVRVFYQPDLLGARANRNFLAAQATQSFLLFIDDDNLILPQALSIATLALSSRRGDVYVFTFWRCYSRPSLQEILKPDFATGILWVPLGGGGEASYLINSLGDMSFLIHRQAFIQLGGLSEESLLTSEDWEFLIKLRAHGYKIQVVPEALQVYCDQSNSFYKRVPPFVSHLNAISKASRDGKVPPFYEMARNLLKKNPGLAHKTLFYGAVPSMESSHEMNFKTVDSHSGNCVTLSIAAGAHEEVQVMIKAITDEIRNEKLLTQPGINILNIRLNTNIDCLSLRFPKGLFFINQIHIFNDQPKHSIKDFGVN